MTVLGNVGGFCRIVCQRGGDGRCRESCDGEDAGNTDSLGDDGRRAIEATRQSERNTLTW